MPRHSEHPTKACSVQNVLGTDRKRLTSQTSSTSGTSPENLGARAPLCPVTSTALSRPLVELRAFERAGGHFVKRRGRWSLRWAPGSRSGWGCRPRGGGTRAGGNSGLGSGDAQALPGKTPAAPERAGLCGARAAPRWPGAGPVEASEPATASAPHKGSGQSREGSGVPLVPLWPGRMQRGRQRMRLRTEVGTRPWRGRPDGLR